MSKRFYCHTDGNGGFVFSKQLLAVVLAVLTIFTIVANVVISATLVQADVSYLQQSQELLFSEIQSQEVILYSQVTDVEVLKTHYSSLSVDIAEMKADIKEMHALLRRLE